MSWTRLQELYSTKQTCWQQSPSPTDCRWSLCWNFFSTAPDLRRVLFKPFIPLSSWSDYLLGLCEMLPNNRTKSQFCLITFLRTFSWILTQKSVNKLSTIINTSFNITILSTSIELASSMARETVSEWSQPSGNAGWGASQGGGVGGVFALGGVAGGAGVFTWWTFFLDSSWWTWLLNIIVWITVAKSVGTYFPKHQEFEPKCLAQTSALLLQIKCF